MAVINLKTDQKKPVIFGKIHSAFSLPPFFLPYYIYVPHNLKNKNNLLISIHGYTRNAAEHCFELAKIAEEKGIVLLVPHFSKVRYPRYQTLQPDKDSNLPEEALDALIEQVSQSLNMDIKNIKVFAYSAGGQFIHRYLMLDKNRSKISRVAIFAPGWFTFPDLDLEFPYGLKKSKKLLERKLTLQNYTTIKTRLFVGDRDINRAGNLKVNSRLDSQQGLTRIQRGRAWVQSMNTAVSKKDSIEIEVINNIGHNFTKNINNDRVLNSVFGWLF